MTDANGPRTLGRRCLLVADSGVTRHMLAFALTRGADLTVVEAADGFEAVRRLKDDRFDLVITDLNLPVLDGVQLVGRIRTDPVHATVPILVLCTEAESADRRRALELGADGYLTRPVQAPSLLAAARDLLCIGEGRGNRSAP